MGMAVEKDYEELHDMFRHHVESFDYMIDRGIETMLKEIKPIEVLTPIFKHNIRIWFDKFKISPPKKMKNEGLSGTTELLYPLYPFECRQSKLTYAGDATVDLIFKYFSTGDTYKTSLKLNIGKFPIMLKSKLCHLRTATPKKLVLCKEEPSGMGGYFIIKGLERVVRLLILPKRNFPMGMVRSSFCEGRKGYTDKAVVIRCVKEDLSAVTVTLYYLDNGGARLGFRIQAREYLLPVGIILVVLSSVTDLKTYIGLIGERANIILDELQNLSLRGYNDCMEHIGKIFQPVMLGLKDEDHTCVASDVLCNYIFVHLDKKVDKFNLLILMLQKLFSIVDGTSIPDNPDSLQNQEVLLPGHLIIMTLKKYLQNWLLRAKVTLQNKVRYRNKEFSYDKLAEIKEVCKRACLSLPGEFIENMLNTGCLDRDTGLELQQRVGMTVKSNRSNLLSFISHFRAVHRGTSYAGLRTLSARKLLPDSWGFLCPVHTPKGEQSGLLNHMTTSCRLTSYYDSGGKLKNFIELHSSVSTTLLNLGVIRTSSYLETCFDGLYVILDGRIVGYIHFHLVKGVVHNLRILKLETSSELKDLEVVHVPVGCGAYPGLYLFTHACRFVRPVLNKFISSEEGQNIEFIGPFEQAYMEISCPDGGDGGRTATYEEIHPTGVLSIVGSLTPWSDYNQSTCNIYQCQMAKQTMGFSCQSINARADQKLYHLQTPQTPIVRTKAYEKFNIDDSPLGTNAIVAVLAYSGYDIPGAIVLNKSSVERGMFSGYMCQTETVDFTIPNMLDLDIRLENNSKTFVRRFSRSKPNKSSYHLIDSDGLPSVGQRLSPNDPWSKGSDHVYVDYVAIDGNNRKRPIQKANIRYRCPRNPEIGDKFSSRHGQKGVCSQLLQDTDMPFSACTGMRPDLIINPHGFPSRISIAMLLESIAAKGGALSGKFVDGTPFSESDNDLGSLLVAKGFNYHGLEVLHSGVYGTELTCEIFTGPVYYQRLLHMVSDKFKVDSQTIVKEFTKQSNKSICFGEMERDSLLAHGAAYLLHDRLSTCSDEYIVTDVCSLCGSVLTSLVLTSHKRNLQEMLRIEPRFGRNSERKVKCVACMTSKGMETVAMPFNFLCLAMEMAAVNIKMTLRMCSES